MYGFSDQSNGIPRTRFSALRQGSSRYSTPIARSIEHTFAPICAGRPAAPVQYSGMDDVAEGIRRVTLPLPTRPGHVHAYLLAADDGWTLVDTGLGLPGARERWQAELAELGGPVRRILITHFHPDHIGAGADVSELTGAEVFESELDYVQCRVAWGSETWPERIAAWFRENGVPPPVANELIETGSGYKPFIRYAEDPTPIGDGDRLDGWDVLAVPGHADGQLCLHREGVLIAADHVLDPISPAVGLYPESRPDPLGDYLASLERVIELEPRVGDRKS